MIGPSPSSDPCNPLLAGVGPIRSTETPKAVVAKEYRKTKVNLPAQLFIIAILNSVDMRQVARNLKSVAPVIGHDKGLSQDIGDTCFDIDVGFEVGFTVVEYAEVGSPDLLNRLPEETRG